MRFGLARLALVAAVSAAVVSPATRAYGQTPVGPTVQAAETKVDVNLKDADMLAATRALTERTGIQFVLRPSTSPFGKITLQLTAVTAEDAIRYICQAAGASFRRDENGVYIIGHDNQEVEAPAPAAPPAPKIVRKIKILKNKASDVYRRMVQSIENYSDEPFRDLDKFKAYSKGDIPASIGQMQPHLTNGGFSNFSVQPTSTSNVPLSGTETGNQITLPGESAGQIGGGGFGGGGGGGGQGLGGGGGGGIGGQGGGGIGGQGGQQTQMKGGTGLVPDGIDFISYNPTDNSLIVQGTEEAIQELQQHVNEFDVAPRQILIKVEFITTNDSINKDFGAEMLYQRGATSAGIVPGTFISQSDPIIFNYASGNIAGELRTYLSEGRGKVVTAPIIRTLNNEPASVSEASITWVFYNETVGTGAVILNEEEPEEFEADTNLFVDPRINDDGTITVALSPTITSLVGSSISPDGTEYPNYVVQSVRVIARVKNNETIVLAGLNSKSDTTSVNKMPILGDLPIIGQFFRHTTVDNSHNDLLIFVTPTILDDEQSSAQGVSP